MPDDLNEKSPVDELFERIFDKEDLEGEEAEEDKCGPDILEILMEEARNNPIWFQDGSSNQDILPIEEQESPRDKYGKRAMEYLDDIPISPERSAQTDEIIRKIRAEIGGPFSDNWVNPDQKKQQ